MPRGGIHFDLKLHAHLADVTQGGLFMDFGTPAQAKYTNGGWGSGWGSYGSRNGETYSYLGKLGRIYFDWPKPEALTLTIKLRRVGGPGMIVYFNNKEIVAPPVEGKGYRTIALDVPESSVKTGDNYLLLRGTKFETIGGQSVAFEIASISVQAKDSLAVADAPYDRATGALKAGGALSYYLEVPKKAQLLVESGGKKGQLSVKATPEGGSAVALGQVPAGKSQLFELEKFGQKITRIEVSTEADNVVQNLQLWAPRGKEVSPEKAKNVVVLLIDTLPAHNLKVYNKNAEPKTPALDAFTKAGALFESAQSPENWTKPSVASILTSLQPDVHRTQGDASKLPNSVLTLGEVFQKAGFRTGSFIANGYVSDAFGFKQGWHKYTNYIREHKTTKAENVFKESMAWIKAHKDQRFFAYIQTIDPHVPYAVPDEYLNMYSAGQYTGPVGKRCTDECLQNAKKGKYSAADKKRIKSLHYAEISYHDHFFEKFLAEFKALGLDKNTIFFIVSDHGEEHGQHDGWGHGHSVYQDLLAVPLIVRWPGAVPAGKRVSAAVSTLDIGPTVLEATGVAIPDAFQGTSLLGHAWDTPPQGPWVAFSYFQENRRVARAQNWKLIIKKNLQTTLFNLAADPGEKEELKPSKHPIAMRYLRIMTGQYLGAKDYGAWAKASTADKPKKKVKEIQGDLNPETCAQLKQLGYLPEGCK